MDENKDGQVTHSETNQNQTEKANNNIPCRDQKGHFIPNPDKASSAAKRISKTRKQKAEKEARKEDENTVKIKIVKEEEPLPEKEFEGKLEDMKERTASNFIKSVARRKPNRISIDGEYYYSAPVLDNMTKKYVRAKNDGMKCLETLKKAMDTLVTSEGILNAYVKENHKVRTSRFIWRSIAFFMIGLVLAFSVSRAIVWYHNSDVNQPIEETTTK